eukprot:Tbor_TRINITY_DN2406_c0_g1::TRINITY_DN2406_c0_g1_i1::g.2547::m.2547/K12598/MTR4, SKIV2L2; ATP-dependent RNA helicase DOB1
MSSTKIQKRLRDEESDANKPPTTSGDDDQVEEMTVNLNADEGASSGSGSAAPIISKKDEEQAAIKKARIEKARKDPALTFPYALDTFQQMSIDHLEAGDSVLVSAHTSAGKTTVAAYAIAKALREKKRVIYTSPIKALSNQKFREFSEQFGSVGLMTGDTTIKSDADCLVMTTEILRSMLYRGTEMLREVGCVVFDEVHYMRDKLRGVVWEETIIMLPEGCQYVFLSATIPNATEFAQWIEHVHPTTNCHVVHTNYRPVPLQHYLYPAKAEGIFLIVDEQGKFRDDNFKKAMTSMGGDDGATDGVVAKSGIGAKGKGFKSKQGNNKAVMDIIRLVMDRKMYPVIVFSFSKVECERYAGAMGKLNFNTTEEDALVTEVFNNAIDNLSTEDLELPAIQHILPLLRKGIGIHHSGLLPILKEIVEVLFQAGLVKVLFSTETFSMGLNMPARTVVFTSVKKFDGSTTRYLTGGEYIQMSGRAGRRGLDRVGVVIAMVDEAVEHDTLKSLTGGGADVLNSSFHLTYNMILNLLRVEDVDPTYMMQRSFSQFQRQRTKPELENKLATVNQLLINHPSIGENEKICLQYENCTNLIEQYSKEQQNVMRKKKYMGQFIVPFRMVNVVRASDGTNFYSGIVKDVNAACETVNVYVICDKLDPSAPRKFVPRHVKDYDSEVAALYVVPFTFADIETCFTVKSTCNADSNDRALIASISKFDSFAGKEAMSPEQLNIKNTSDDPEGQEFWKRQDRIARLKAQLEKNLLYIAKNDRSEDGDEISSALHKAYEIFLERKELKCQYDTITAELNDVSKIVFVEELGQMKRVLRRLDFLDKDHLIMRKARVACEITDESEIYLTELLFHGVFNEMDTKMVVALLSCLVNVHRTPDNFSLPEEFQGPLDELKKVVDRVATVSVEAGLISCVSASSERGDNKSVQGDKDEKSSASNDKVMPSLMEVTYKWADGAKFVDVVTMTDAFEGEIVRMLRRLEEMLRQLAGAAKSPALGNQELHDKFMKGIEMIKRGIVFASSLYLS